MSYVSNVVCPACNAQVGHPCTQPTNTGRVGVSWFHYARERAAQDEQREQK